MENLEISIGQLSRDSGFPTSAIRYYESLGLLNPARTIGGQRRYPESAITDLKLIGLAKSCGFTLREMSELIAPINQSGPLFSHWQSVAKAKIAELDAAIEKAKEMKLHLLDALECRCDDLTTCPLMR